MYSFENATNYQNTTSNALNGLHDDGEIGGTGDSWKQYAKSGDIILDLAGGLGGGVGAGLSGVALRLLRLLERLLKVLTKSKYLKQLKSENKLLICLIKLSQTIRLQLATKN
ncbi:hypothetical protein BSPWISOXPB_7405 [uncultured Gammaproteobacteria bacterium]|nr:hypothetical protein BSPWISOXPB_7405 [uncultured Gammaproteobacteria bacterium]